MVQQVPIASSQHDAAIVIGLESTQVRLAIGQLPHQGWQGDVDLRRFDALFGRGQEGADDLAAKLGEAMPAQQIIKLGGGIQVVAAEARSHWLLALQDRLFALQGGKRSREQEAGSAGMGTTVEMRLKEHKATLQVMSRRAAQLTGAGRDIDLATVDSWTDSEERRALHAMAKLIEQVGLEQVHHLGAVIRIAGHRAGKPPALPAKAGAPGQSQEGDVL